jgi:hypothetical protein
VAEQRYHTLQPSYHGLLQADLDGETRTEMKPDPIWMLEEQGRWQTPSQIFPSHPIHSNCRIWIARYDSDPIILSSHI